MTFQRDLTELLDKIVVNTPGGGATIVTLGTAACAYLLVSSFKNKNKIVDGWREVPSPKGSLPYFGHLFKLDEVPIKQFNKWHEELGPIIKVNMGVKEWYSIADPFLAHQIFNVHGKSSSGRPHATFLTGYYAHGGKGIVAGNPSTQFNKTRGAMQQVISPKNRAIFEKIYNPDADAFVEKILDISEKSGSVNVLAPLRFTSLNVILSACFGRKVASTDDPLFKEIIAALSETSVRAGPSEEINSFLPIMSVVDFLLRKEKGMLRFIQEKRDPLFTRLIQEAMDGDVDCLTKSMFEMGDDVNEFANVLVTMSDSIMAGTDTSAVMLQWSFVILCRYPNVQQKIRDELDRFIREHGRLPTLDERECLPYSISVQKECMRYKPVTFFGLPHSATEDIQVDGYHIPKGATLVANMFAMHRNEEFFPNANTFMPERFLHDIRPMHQTANLPADKRDHFNFGWGRRVCPGAYLGELEIFNIWIRVFAKCIIEAPLDDNGNPIYPDMDTIINAGVVTPPKNPIVRIIRRTDAIL